MPDGDHDDSSSATQRRILDALVGVIVEGGLPEFSIQEVADRAGVSHRTVYRHFPSRESLLEGIVAMVNRRMAEQGGVTQPDGLDGLADAVRTNFALFSREALATEAGVRFRVGAAIDVEDRRRRTEMIRALVTDDVAGLSPHDGSMAAAVLRHLAGGQTWLGLRESGLDDEATARASAWAVAVLVDALHDGRTPSAQPELHDDLREGAIP